MNNNKPIIGITLGDPAGVGPEITIKAMNNEAIHRICRPLIIGDANVLKLACKTMKLNMNIRVVTAVSEALFSPDVINVYDLSNVDMETFQPGQVKAVYGQAAYEAVVKVIELALLKEIDATVTNPINKEALSKAGLKFAGHTEIYAAQTKTEKYSMLLVEGELRVVHVSTHVSLREACERVKKARVLETIQLAHNVCKSLGIEIPKIGVAGLNPHSGENGLFGMEEIEEIIPAINAAKEAGLQVEGPVPPDTLFPKAIGGWYDIVVAMYHDQGHIPLKVVGFNWDKHKGQWTSINGVNITLGLPIIRTSVDHGTAFDIAWKGIASEKSLISAIEYAVKMVGN